MAAPRARPNLTQTRRPWLTGCTRRRNPPRSWPSFSTFSFKKRQAEDEIEFVITVKEFAPRNALQMRFYAQADKEVNQRTAPFRPFGWGDTLVRALSECMPGHPPVPPTIRDNDQSPQLW